MKLATYKDGSRDGQLVVVSRDLRTAHYATGIAHRLQQVLDDWAFYAPQLQDLYDALNADRARHPFDFNPAQCMAPLPRAYQWLDGSAYLNHVELVRQARGAAAQERKRLAEEQQRKLQVQRAAEQERRAALEVCKKSREARLYELADAILMSRMAIEMSEADIEREKSIEKKTGVVNQKALYDAGRLLEDAKNMIKISMPEYQSLGGRERDLKSIASKNPCAA